MAVAVAGIVTLVTRGDFGVLMELEFRIGDLWMLLAGLLWAVYSIILRKKPTDMNQTAYLGSTFLIGVLPLIPAALMEQTLAPQWNMTLPVMGSILYIGLGASLMSYMLWTRAVTAIGPVNSSLIYYSLPLFAGIEAYLFLGEPITWTHLTSFLLIVGGIVLATHPRFNRQARATRPE